MYKAPVGGFSPITLSILQKNSEIGKSSSFVSSPGGLSTKFSAGASTSAPPSASRRDLLEIFDGLFSVGNGAGPTA